MAMSINDAVTAIEVFLHSYESGGTRPAGFQVRPSGDEVDEIKVFVDLGGAVGVDGEAWARGCEEAIRAGVPEARPLRVHVRAEADLP